MPIKALVFDCGGVVLRDRDESYYARWEQRLGLDAGVLKQELYQGFLWSEAELGKISEDQFWRSAGERYGLSPAESDALGADAWKSWGVDPVVLSLVKRARGRFRIAMLSNATDALESKLSAIYGIADFFDPIVNSSRLGIAKPAPRSIRSYSEGWGSKRARPCSSTIARTMSRQPRHWGCTSSGLCTRMS